MDTEGRRIHPPKAAKRAGVMVASILASLALIGSALAAEATNTNFFAGGGSGGGVIEGLIWVDGGGDSVFDGSVRVKLFKRVDGSWVQKAARAATPDGSEAPGYWYVRFGGAPRSGTCKMVARFSGTDEWAASQGSLKGPCGSSNWQW